MKTMKNKERLKGHKKLKISELLLVAFLIIVPILVVECINIYNVKKSGSIKPISNSTLNKKELGGKEVESDIKFKNKEVKEPKKLLSEDKKIENVKELVEYNGEIEHIFFHPLILDKEAAFSGPRWHTDNMDDWFVTKEEFEKILSSIYKKGFILIDPNTIYKEQEINNKKLFKRKPIKVPKDKKPLILSIDDLSYNEGMKKATALKLILDKEGNIATYRKDKNGKEVIAKNEIVNIIDEFVSKNPDFSLNGAKGIIALTGYEGVFGYRSNLDSPNRVEEAKKAKVIADKLKEDGWKFASHSYGHLDNEKIDFKKLKVDADKWDKLVKSIIGETDIYIYPHGTSVPENSDKFKYLQSKGFKIFYSVDSKSSEIISQNTLAVRAGRLAVDGISMRGKREKFLKFFDSKEIIDLKNRPKRHHKF